ncbi:beta-propeller fold lactonase family protein [Nocardia sp. NPDC050378]|uniref:lactonase family protein n=1 Tax=Nocardia sp. NPDC050378 TaxID=3155400 RepID=UPI0033DAEFE8
MTTFVRSRHIPQGVAGIKKAAAVLTVLLLTSAGATSGASAAPDDNSRFLTLAGTLAGDVAVLHIAPDGALAPVAGSPFSVGPGIFSVVNAPGSNNVYVTQVGTQRVTGYRISADGSMVPIPGAEVPMNGGPVATSAVSPDGRLLFVGQGGAPGKISTYAISTTGALSPRSTLEVAGLGLAPMVTVDPTGRFLHWTSVVDGTVTVFRIGANGELTAVGEPVAAGTVPVNPGYTPDGRFVYVSQEQGGKISGFAIGPNGELTPTPGSPYPAGTMPHAAVVTADGTRVYVPQVAGGSVAGFSIGADGALTPLPNSPYSAPIGSGPGMAVLSDDEKRLYAADTLTINVTSRIHTFDVRADGSLAPSSMPAVDTGVVFGDGPTMVKTP